MAKTNRNKAPRPPPATPSRRLLYAAVVCVVFGGLLRLAVRFALLPSPAELWHEYQRPGAGYTSSAATASGFYGLSAADIDGQEVSMDEYRGQVVLIVNVASACGLTESNYRELAQLDRDYRHRGLAILAFPCNQFGLQEPGSASDIKTFAAARGISFRIMSKVDVNGADEHPVFAWLKTQEAEEGGRIGWNFAKFLVSKDGVLRARFAPQDTPLSMATAIDALLKEVAE